MSRNNNSGKKWYFILGFVVGFVLAAHWNFGRKMLMEYSPLKTNAMEQTGQVIMQGADSTVKQMKEKVVK